MMNNLTFEEMYSLLTPENKLDIQRFVDELLAEQKEEDHHG